MLVSLTTTSLIPTHCGDVSCRREEQILKEFNSIELFAGAGGLALGLSLSGLSVKGLIEKDVNCCETLRSNAPRYFPEARIVMRDIQSLSVSETLRLVKVAAREIDVISGGP